MSQRTNHNRVTMHATPTTILYVHQPLLHIIFSCRKRNPLNENPLPTASSASRFQVHSKSKELCKEKAYKIARIEL